MTDTLTPTYWEDAADDALSVIHHHFDRVKTLDGLRDALNAFIDEQFGKPVPVEATVERWVSIGGIALNISETDYPETRKYLTRYDIHALLIKKQRDYGHENILRFGRDGLLIRVHDKVARLENLTATGATPENDALTDTLADIIGYAAIGVMVATETFALPLQEA